MKKISLSIVALSAICSLMYGNDGSSSDVQVKEGISSFSKKNYEKSYDLFNDAVTKYPQNPQVFYYYGRSALETKRYDEAIEAFEKVLILDPSHTRTRLELARAYFEAGQLDEAQRLLKKAQEDPSVPEKVKENIANLLQAISMKKQEAIVNGFLIVGLGWDSNVNSDIGEDTFNLPLFNIDVTGNKEQHDYFNNNMVGINYIKDFGAEGGWVFKANAIALNTNYMQYVNKNLGGFVLTAGPAYYGKDYEIYFPLTYTKILQGAVPYVQNYSAGVRWTKQFDKTLMLSLGYRYAKTLYQEPGNDKDTAQNNFTLNLNKQLSEKWALGFASRYATSDATRAQLATEGNVANTELEGVINATYSVTSSIDLTAGVLLKKTNYKEDDVFFNSKREDTYRNFMFSSLYKIDKVQSLRGDVGVIKSLSSHAPYEYDKTTVGLQYIRSF